MLESYQNFIFDLDGTLVNSSDEVIRCFKLAFEKSCYPIDNTRLTSDIIGPPLRDIILSIVPELTNEDMIAKITENFRQIYDYDKDDISVMYDGMFDLLNDLKNRNKKLFLATLKPEIPTMRVLDKFHIKNLFDDIYTIDKFGEHINKTQMISDIISKNGLEKSQTVMIGDASGDVIAAKNSGIAGIGVLWGYGTDKTKLIENSTKVIKEVKEIYG